jgi:hypothetical protein
MGNSGHLNKKELYDVQAYGLHKRIIVIYLWLYSPLLGLGRFSVS